MNWRYVKVLEDIKLINEFEEKYGFSFSDEFKECVTKYNGGRPEHQVFDTDIEKERTIKALLSFNKNDKETIWKMAEWSDSIIKKGYFPFATDDAGNMICFTKHYNNVVIIDHEDDHAEVIASTFNSFLNKLYSI